MSRDVENLRACLLELKKLYAWGHELGLGQSGGGGGGGKKTKSEVAYSDPAGEIVADVKRQAIRNETARTATAINAAMKLMGNYRTRMRRVTQDPGVVQPQQPGLNAAIDEDELRAAIAGPSPAEWHDGGWHEVR